MACEAGRGFGGSLWSQEHAGGALLLEGISPSLLPTHPQCTVMCHCFLYLAYTIALLVVHKTHCILFSKMVCSTQWYSLLLKHARVCYSNRTRCNLAFKPFSSFHQLHSFSRSQKRDPKSAVFTERSVSVFLQLQKKHLLP